jgi:hypothetical protein
MKRAARSFGSYWPRAFGKEIGRPKHFIQILLTRWPHAAINRQHSIPRPCLRSRLRSWFIITVLASFPSRRVASLDRRETTNPIASRSLPLAPPFAFWPASTFWRSETLSCALPIGCCPLRISLATGGVDTANSPELKSRVSPCQVRRRTLEHRHPTIRGALLHCCANATLQMALLLLPMGCLGC